MNLHKEISKVADLNGYIELTQEVENKYEDVKIVVNMSTILCLKKIRSLEIEYFNKCDGNGAAFKLFDRMLSSPPSKTWGLLGAEVIGIIQYWLDAVRKDLISHHIHWWAFLKQTLGFIKELRQKDQGLSSLLVEEIAESMLELATSGKPDVNQRYEILHTFNLFCAESSREIRVALRPQFEPYFIRLAALSAACGHLPAQLAALEALVRWLQPRHAPAARRHAAALWFPPHLYARAAVDVFLARGWMNFFQDARDFLNCHNETQDLITSVICRKLSVGNVVVISGEGRRHSWLDVNSGSESVTVVLEPQILEALGVPHLASCETLLIEKHSVSLVKLYRQCGALTLSLQLCAEPGVAPSGVSPWAGARDVTAELGPRTPPRLHHALRAVFADRYQVLLDVESMTCYSPPPAEEARKNSPEQNYRFSHPVKEKRRRPQAGFVAWSRRFATLKSPSTASTASLAQLHDKLAKLPYYEFTKEPVSVCAQPELSVVNELNESEISNSLGSNSTLKLRRCAVRNFRTRIENRKSLSDSETVQSKKITENDDDDEQNSFEQAHKNVRGSQSEKYVKQSAQVGDPGVSSLFAATIGSTDISVINETIERLPKDKEINTDNLIDLLVQEALQSKEKNCLSDSGINIEDSKKTQEDNVQDNETIEDTQYTGPLNTRSKNSAGLRNIVSKTPKNKSTSKSTSDESNTEAINETPVNFVNVRRRNQRKINTEIVEVNKPDENTTFDVKDVEQFFSQHFAENQMGDVIISPTLAKKINETSSEPSEEYLMKDIYGDFDIGNDVIPDLDIVECLNDIVDKVCCDFEKCSVYLDKAGTETKILNMAKYLKTPSEDIPPEDTLEDDGKDIEKQKHTKNTKMNKKNVIKLKFTSKKQKPKAKAKGKLKLEPVSKMSIIPEANNESEAYKSPSSDTRKTSTDDVNKTPLARRKRKLYSPKDDQIQFDKSVTEISSGKPDPDTSDIEDEIALVELKKDKLVTPKSAASCYKEIEKERKKYKRIRARKSRNLGSPPSPKTKRHNDIFEQLKNNIEVHGNDKIILVDKKSDKDVAIFNFTSDSEDEDFKQKKTEIQKRTSTTTIGSGTSIMTTRLRRTKKPSKYTEDEEESPKKPAKPAKSKRASRRKPSKTNIQKSREVEVDHPSDLIDERMREANPVQLNTSFVASNVDDKIKDPEPLIHPPEIEIIPDENANMDIEDCKEKVVCNEKVTRKKKDEKAMFVENYSAKEQDEKPGTTETIKVTKTNKNASKKEEYIKPGDVLIKDDDRTISPLPGLVIETEIAPNERDDSFTTNLERKLQKFYKDGPDAYNDTITTQNMLSDNDKATSSPKMNITDELCGVFGEGTSSHLENNRESNKKSSKDKGLNSDSNTIDDSINSEHMSKISKTDSLKSKKRNKLRLKCKNKNDSSITISPAKEDTITVKTIKYNKNENQIVINDSQKSNTKSIKSHIDEIKYDEIINVDTERVTRSKVAKARSRSKEIDIVSLTADTEERSIVTDGITGHGDIDELPPSPKLLGEKLTPREIEDMDSTIREYYIELSNKVNLSKGSSESRMDNKDETVHIKAMKSVVQEDSISEARSYTQKSDKNNRQEPYKNHDYAFEKLLPSRRETESESLSQTSGRTPTISVTRLSTKDFSKWLPLAKYTPGSSFESKKTQEPKDRKIQHNILNKLSSESSFETAKKSQKTTEQSPRVTRNRKSQISPIKLEEFLPKRKVLRKDTSRSNDEILETQDEVMSKLDSIAKKYFLRPTCESSPISRAGKSDESSPKTVTKRKSPIAKGLNIKKRKLDEDFRFEPVDIYESRDSSNVEEWLKKMSTNSTVDNTDDVSSDALQNLIEKLDTTLVEINQTTTKNFVGLFVEAQKQLVTMKEARRNSYQEIRELIDRRFAEMEELAEERDAAFMSWLRARAGDLLRRDAAHKRALLALLRDDARQAATMRATRSTRKTRD